jgi:predicted transposase YbfD/YdcC
MIVADALHCQKETAKAIVKKKADYLLSVKENQSDLKHEIEDYIQSDELRQTMNTDKTLEKNRNRIERRTAYTTDNIHWLHNKADWDKIACIGAIHTQVTTPKGTTSEWHYYISSQNLTAKELLIHARLEWSVETMHWLLDVHFDEDHCRIEDKTVQQNLNIIRKIALNTIKCYKANANNKRPISKIMLDCTLDPLFLLNLIFYCEN